MYLDNHRPTLWGTLAQMAAVSWTIWLDYLDSARSARRRRRHERRYALSTAPAWRSDLLLIAIAALAALACVLLVLVGPLMTMSLGGAA